MAPVVPLLSNSRQEACPVSVVWVVLAGCLVECLTLAVWTPPCFSDLPRSSEEWVEAEASVDSAAWEVAQVWPPLLHRSRS